MSILIQSKALAPSCPLCGGNIISTGSCLVCTNSPCEWSLCAKEYVKTLEYESKGKGEPCKRGEAASRSGCIPKQKKQAKEKTKQTIQSASASSDLKQPKMNPSPVADRPELNHPKMEQAKEGHDPPESLRSFLDKDNARKLMGAVDGADITTSWDGKNLTIKVNHPDIEDCVRTLGIDDQGKPFIYNNNFVVKKTAPKGFGSAQFERQVAEAKKAGFAYIETFAGGKYGHKLNGYYTWPVLGYDQDIKDLQPVARQRAKGQFPDAVSVLDIMSVPDVAAGKVEFTEEEAQEVRDKCAAIDEKLGRPVRDRTKITGKDWWLVHGEDLHHAVFKLNDNSRSIQINSAYNAAKVK